MEMDGSRGSPGDGDGDGHGWRPDRFGFRVRRHPRASSRDDSPGPTRSTTAGSTRTPSSFERLHQNRVGLRLRDPHRLRPRQGDGLQPLHLAQERRDQGALVGRLLPAGREVGPDLRAGQDAAGRVGGEVVDLRGDVRLKPRGHAPDTPPSTCTAAGLGIQRRGRAGTLALRGLLQPQRGRDSDLVADLRAGRAGAGGGGRRRRWGWAADVVRVPGAGGVETAVRGGPH